MLRMKNKLLINNALTWTFDYLAWLKPMKSYKKTYFLKVKRLQKNNHRSNQLIAKLKTLYLNKKLRDKTIKTLKMILLFKFKV